MSQQTLFVAYLTHWGRVMHIFANKLTIISPDNGLSPERHQAITRTNVGILLIGPGTNFSEISIEIQTFSFKKMHLKMSSAKWRAFCLGPIVLMCSAADHNVLQEDCQCIVTGFHKCEMQPFCLGLKALSSYFIPNAIKRIIRSI